MNERQAASKGRDVGRSARGRGRRRRGEYEYPPAEGFVTMVLDASLKGGSRREEKWAIQ